VGSDVSGSKLGKTSGAGQMWRRCGFGELVAVMGFALIIGSGTARAQIDGAVQYPPRSIGEDAQPPPPARMVPQSVSPRRIELGVSGSSQLPANYEYQSRPRTGIDRLILPDAPRSPAPTTAPSTAGGN